MDLAQIVVTAGGILLMAATLWFFFGAGGKPGGKKDPGAGAYACPMHPWITSADPGATCSLCGMQLVRRDQTG